jgi:hypothetical protein
MRTCLAKILFVAVVPILLSGSPESFAQQTDPILQKIKPQWVQDEGFYYSKAISNGQRQFVWVEPTEKKVLRANSLEELEKLSGRNLTQTSSSGRIEPSETLDEARIDIEIKNLLDKQVELYWIDFQGVPRSYGKLSPNQSQKQSTFAGHSWAATIDGSKPIWCATVSAQGQRLEIQSMNIESDSLFPNRNGRRRPNRNRGNGTSDSFITGKYKIERDNYQTRESLFSIRLAWDKQWGARLTAMTNPSTGLQTTALQ